LLSYIFTPIDVPGAVWTIASGINNSGQVVGSDSNGDGFLWSASSFTTIDVPGATLTTPSEEIWKFEQSG
jgi:hypothetical protein